MREEERQYIQGVAKEVAATALKNTETGNGNKAGRCLLARFQTEIGMLEDMAQCCASPACIRQFAHVLFESRFKELARLLKKANVPESKGKAQAIVTIYERLAGVGAESEVGKAA